MTSSSARLVGLVGASAATLLVGTVALWEGRRNEPYADMVGRLTVCFGETNVPMRRYSNAECDEMLAGSLHAYAVSVLARNPELKGHPNQLAAATSLAYNVGVVAYRRSTVARRFTEGRWREACDAFLRFSYAGGRQVKGLLNRRKHERAICLKDLP